MKIFFFSVILHQYVHVIALADPFSFWDYHHVFVSLDRINVEINTAILVINSNNFSKQKAHLTGNYLLKVNNINTGTRWEICSKLTINTPERRHRHLSDVFIVNFEHISHLVLVLILLTLSR